MGINSTRTNEYKTLSKSIWSSTKRKRVRTGPLFSKKEDKIVFNFQHYVKPEKIVNEYIRVNIYNKPRFVKVDKKETSKSLSIENQSAAEVDRDSSKSKERSSSKRQKLRAHSSANERRQPGWRLNKSTESTKKSRRAPNRISATHNFVYEFDPFANSASTGGNAIKGKASQQHATGIGQGDSPLRSTSIKHFSDARNKSVAAALPKLHPRSDTVTNSVGKQKNVAGCSKNTNLPRIKEQEGTIDQRLVKDRGKWNAMSDIDREVEKVKSDWQALRTNDWMPTKHIANPRTKKLYDTLDKMTLEIDRIQKSYLDTKSNRYLKRGATKTLDPPQLSFEEKAEQIKNALFPKGSERTIPSEASLKGTCSSKKLESKFLLPNARSESFKSDDKPGLSNFNRQYGNVNDRNSLKKMDSDIRQYFENYISDAEKNFSPKEESSDKQQINTAPNDVEEMLKKLNINSFDMYDIGDYGDEDEEDSPLHSIERKKTRDGFSKTAANEKIEKSMVSKGTSDKDVSPKEDDYIRRYNNVLNTDTSTQSNSKSDNKNVFLEMSLNALNTNLPPDAMSRILQSEYLKKDMSLKPM